MNARHYVAVACVFGALAVVFVRAAVSSSADLDTAMECEKAGLTTTAIDFYGRAARWYTPFSSTSSDAIEGLLRISEGHGQPDDGKTAKRALYEARGAILATRWIVTPHRERLDDVNRRIADLESTTSNNTEAGGDPAGMHSLLQKTSSPRTLPALLSVLLFVAWVVVTITGAGRAVTPDGRLAGTRAVLWLAASAALLFAWLIILAFA